MMQVVHKRQVPVYRERLAYSADGRGILRLKKLSMPTPSKRFLCDPLGPELAQTNRRRPYPRYTSHAFKIDWKDWVWARRMMTPENGAGHSTHSDRPLFRPLSVRHVGQSITKTLPGS